MLSFQTRGMRRTTLRHDCVFAPDVCAADKRITLCGVVFFSGPTVTNLGQLNDGEDSQLYDCLGHKPYMVDGGIKFIAGHCMQGIL